MHAFKNMLFYCCKIIRQRFLSFRSTNRACFTAQFLRKKCSTSKKNLCLLSVIFSMKCPIRKSAQRRRFCSFVLQDKNPFCLFCISCKYEGQSPFKIKQNKGKDQYGKTHNNAEFSNLSHKSTSSSHLKRY